MGHDLDKPWGAYFVIHPEDTTMFIETYFSEHKDKFSHGVDFSPKYLIVEPGKRLSWQVHARRGEIWKVVEGPVGAFVSETDEHPDQHIHLPISEVLYMDKDVRHRLVGLEDWGVVAEIWVHTDAENLSDESDITRIHDDFSR